MSNVINRSTHTSFLKRVGKYFLFIGLALVLTMSASAQAVDPGNDPDYIAPDTTVPFDSGVYVLVAVGVAYGVKQWYKTHKNNKAVTGIEAI